MDIYEEAKHSLAKYWDMLNKHDWYYTYSDDHGVYQRGVDSENELKRIAKHTYFHMALFDGFHKHHFSGEAWRTEKAPKPERPEE